MEWIPLVLNFLQPLLLKCFEKTSSEDPQEFLRESYNPVTGKMDPDVVRDAMPETRRALRRARREAPASKKSEFPKLDRDGLYDLAEKGLIDAMNADPVKVTTIRAAASAIRDND